MFILHPRLIRLPHSTDHSPKKVSCSRFHGHDYLWLYSSFLPLNCGKQCLKLFSTAQILYLTLKWFQKKSIGVYAFSNLYEKSFFAASPITSAHCFKSLQTSPLAPPLHSLFQPQPFWLVVCKVIVNVFCNATLLFWRVVCKVNFLEFFVLWARCLWSHCQFFSLSVKSTF